MNDSHTGSDDLSPPSHEQLQRINELINRSPMVVIEWFNRPGWPVRFVSDTIRRWGYEPEVFRRGQLPYSDLIHPDDAPRIHAEVEHFLTHGPDQYQQEYRLRCADGRWIWVDDRTTLERDAQGQVTVISGVLLDITDRVQAQSERQLLAVMADNASDALILTVNGRFKDCNQAALRLFGFEDRADFLGHSPADVSPFLQADGRPSEQVASEWLKAAMQGQTQRFEWTHHRRDGSSFEADVGLVHYRLPDGQDAVIGIVRDISERKAQERLLQERARRLEAAQRIGRMGSWDMDAISREIRWSPETFRIHGIVADAALPSLSEAMELVHPEDRERVAQALDDAIGGKMCEVDYRILRPAGEVRHLKLRAEPVMERGTPVRVEGTVQDVTELTQALRERDRLTDVLENTTDIVSMADPTGRVFYFNRAGYEVLGLDRGQPLDDVIRHVHPPWAAQLVHDEGIPTAIREGRWLGETAVIGANGQEIPMSQLVMSHRNADGELDYLWTILRDISDRKRIEQALSRSEQRYTLAARVGRSAAWEMWPLEGRAFSDANLASLLGYELEDLGESLAAWLQTIPEEARAAVAEAMQPVIDGRTDTYQVEHPVLRKDGSRGWVRVRGQRVTAPGEVPLRIVGSSLDITDAVQAAEQLRQANQVLEQRVAERTVQLLQANQELEAFSYTVSHDLKAPLRGIDGYSQLLVEDYAEQLDETGRQFVQRIRDGVRIMGDLIGDLLEYSRMERRDMVRDPVAVQTLVQQVLDGYESDVRQQGVCVDISLPAVTLALDPEGMAVVLRNLVGNAIKFSRDSKPPRITIGGELVDGRCRLWVRDNGIGFDMKYHDRVFAMFQRLHRAEEFSGTGVGLALVAKAVHRMGGRVWAQSAPGEGATFYLEFSA
ncbi:PAS domain S-box protein [Hydrogenophaga sp.]|uniref:PAS domain-containing sensor histidine kinase n=1 Tax=Hydrogenophaga sp. TaxID=1904254 RepID=UPI0035B3ED89